MSLKGDSTKNIDGIESKCFFKKYLNNIYGIALRAGSLLKSGYGLKSQKIFI